MKKKIVSVTKKTKKKVVAPKKLAMAKPSRKVASLVRKPTAKRDVSVERAIAAARAASNIQAIDIRIFDIRDVSSFADCFVICSGQSDRQVNAIADSVVHELKKQGTKPIGVEGQREGEWVLVDYGNVVVHVFHPELRSFYNVEGLWSDAKEIPFKE